MQRFVAEAARYYQAGQLREVAAHAAGQFTAALHQISVDLAADNHGRKHRLTIEADWRIQQAIVAHHTLAFVPEQVTVAADIQLCLKVARIEALATGRSAQRNDVPIEQLGVALQFDGRGELGLCCRIDDGFLRQPFQIGSGFELSLQRDLGPAPLRLHPERPRLP